MRRSYALLLTCLVLAATIEGRRKLKREQRYELSEDEDVNADFDPDGDYDDVNTNFVYLIILIRSLK